MKEITSTIPYSSWVKYFLSYPILATQSRSATVNSLKKAARVEIAKQIKKELGIEMTEGQVSKSFSNKKSRIVEKCDKSTGNVDPNLTPDEILFEKFLHGNGDSTDEGKTGIGSGIVNGRLDFGASAGATGSSASTSYIEFPDIDSANEEVATINAQVLEDFNFRLMSSPAASPSPSTMLQELTVTGAKRPLVLPAVPDLPRPQRPPHLNPAVKRRREEEELRFNVLSEQLQYYQEKNRRQSEAHSLENRVNRLERLLMGGNVHVAKEEVKEDEAEKSKKS